MTRFRGIVLANSIEGREQPRFARRCAPQLVCVANRSILFHALDRLREAGIAEIGVIVDPRHGEEIREAAGSGARWQLSISYYEQPPLGALDGVRAAAEMLGDAAVVVYPATGVLLHPLRPLLRQFTMARLAALLPADYLDDYAGAECAGIHIFDPFTVRRARSAERSWRGQVEPADVIRMLQRERRRVQVRRVEGWWSYRGHPDELLEGNRLVLDGLADDRRSTDVFESTIVGRVSIAASARIESTTIHGPAVIGAGAELADAYIGPYTSIGDGAKVQAAEIENSVIMADAVVSDVGTRVVGSVIGESATVDRSVSVRRVLELAVAHGSRATIA